MRSRKDIETLRGPWAHISKNGAPCAHFVVDTLDWLLDNTKEAPLPMGELWGAYQEMGIPDLRATKTVEPGSQEHIRMLEIALEQAKGMTATAELLPDTPLEPQPDAPVEITVTAEPTPSNVVLIGSWRQQDAIRDLATKLRDEFANDIVVVDFTVSESPPQRTDLYYDEARKDDPFYRRFVGRSMQLLAADICVCLPPFGADAALEIGVANGQGSVVLGLGTR